VICPTSAAEAEIAPNSSPIAHNISRERINFREAFQYALLIRICSVKHLAFVFRKNMIVFRRPASSERGASRSSRVLDAGCDGRGSHRQTCDTIADGQVVWSWRPGLALSAPKMIGVRR
jgi:hypothetical protein